MIEFIEKLEKLEVGSREASDDILLKLGWTFLSPNTGQIWTDPAGKRHISDIRPDPSRSLEDIISLIPEVIHWLIHDGNRMASDHPKGFSSLYFGDRSLTYITTEKDYVYGRAATPALAMCSALMRYHLEMTMRKLTELGEEMEESEKMLSDEETKWR